MRVLAFKWDKSRRSQRDYGMVRGRSGGASGREWRGGSADLGRRRRDSGCHSCWLVNANVLAAIQRA